MTAVVNTIYNNNKYPDDTGTTGSSSGSRDGVSSGYPVMRLPTQEQAPTLRFVTPGGHMLGWSKYAQGK